MVTTKKIGRPGLSEDEKQKIRDLNSQGKLDGEIAEIINRSRVSVIKARKKMGLPPVRMLYWKLRKDVVVQS